MEYAVCEANSAAGLAQVVNMRLGEGWRLSGNLFVVNGINGTWWYFQAVVRGPEPAKAGS